MRKNDLVYDGVVEEGKPCNLILKTVLVRLHRIHGIEVKGTLKDIPERLRAMDIREVIVAIPSLSEEKRQEVK